MVRDGMVRPLGVRHIIQLGGIPYSKSKLRNGGAAMCAGSVDTFRWIVLSVKVCSIWYANMASELNDRIRRPVPIRVYRVNTHRRHYRTTRTAPRPAHVNSELNYDDRGPYHRDVHSRPARPPADDKENVRPAPPANPAHLQTSVGYDRYDVNMSSSVLATGTKMETKSGNPIEQLDNPHYVQTSVAVDIQSTRSDTLATSTESSTHENLPSLSFNASGDIVMTADSQAVVDDYCASFEHVADLLGRYRKAHATFAGIKINQTRNPKEKRKRKTKS
ncbi:hypothetical protein AARAC_007267 [Aspergillus arachidicola]|uniref:Uncharacterized protein n=1 Tax=Aspergillus arachidicola TaxID=656916 RepID=A0A2G7G5R6_9EURO|nr:hypothetical protein AARAC_007267 [Aspergillus arachidicola]